MLSNGRLFCILFACTVFTSIPASADTFYIKERVINSAVPGSPQITFPTAKIANYSNSIGFPTNCSVATQYDGHDGAAFWTIPDIQQRCTPQSSSYDPPLMHMVRYPITGEPNTPRPGILFSRPAHWTTSTAGGFATYWNLLYSTNQPGWVYADTVNDRYLQFAMMAPHLADSAAVGAYVAYDYKLYYRLRLNGAFPLGDQFRPVIASNLSEFHPFPNAYVGQHGATIPGTAFVHKTANGDVLATMSITEGSGPPPHATSVSSGYVLRGVWNAVGTDVTWTVSQPASLPFEYSTRGADEPAVLELSSANTGAVNCILIVRASNEYYPGTAPGNLSSVAGHHWLFRSKDGCKTWDGSPARFGYSDGTPFYAPAANSILFRAPQNGRVYWIGSISATNSQGNWPRTKLIAGEVDLQSATPGIIKDTVLILDEMHGADTDLVHLTNAQMAMQSDGTAFVYLSREDSGCGNCTKPTSWYSLSIAQQTGVTISVATSGSSTHVLSWQPNGASVNKYHVRRRYLSGNPLTDLWEEVASLPGSSTGTTITGYGIWQEAEYEIVADLASGGASTSNRVITRFSSWTGPRLSFSFPNELSAGDTPPAGAVFIRWSYDQPTAIAGFRLYRRYFSDNGSATGWAIVGDANASSRQVTLGGYSSNDRFELRMNAVLPNGIEVPSNTIFVRFPTRNDPLRRPY